MDSLDIIKQHIIKTLTSYDLSRKNKSLRAELGKIHTLADKLSKNNGWISVDDKGNPPPINQEVMVWLTCEYPNKGTSVQGFATDKYIVDECYKGFGFEYHNNVLHKDNKAFVTHWQPLPEDPKDI